MLVALAGVTIGVSAGLHQGEPATIKPMDLNDPAQVREALAFDPFHPDGAAEPAVPARPEAKVAAVSLGVPPAKGSEAGEIGKPAAGKGVKDAGVSAAVAADGTQPAGTAGPAGEEIASAGGEGTAPGGGSPKGAGGVPKGPGKPSPAPAGKAGGLTAEQMQGLIWAGAIAGGAVGTVALVVAVSDANNSSRSPVTGPVVGGQAGK
jgi:hypothetical protein